MASESIVRIVINAVDKYSGVLTGLNQGLELVGKAFTGLSTVAVGSFNAIKVGLDGLKEGGDFLELRRQYESLAQSFGKSGEQILRTFQDVSGGVLNATDSIRLASKAISSGLTNPEIEAAVKYTKRWSEATGQDFAQLSATVFEAFNSGRFAILKQMGLLIDKTTSASDVLRQMEQNMGVFSDTGLNVGDSLNAIASAIDDFVLFSRAAIANSDTLSRALDYIATSARDFVRSFDFEVVTQYFDTLVRALKIVFDAVKVTFSDIGSTIYNTFKNLQTGSGITEFFRALGTYSLEAAKAVQYFGNLAIDAFTSVTKGIGQVIEGVGFFGKMIKTDLTKQFGELASNIDGLMVGMAQRLNEFIQSSPALQNAFGADTIANSLTSFIRSTSRAKREWDDLVANAGKSQDAFTALDSWGIKTKKFAESLDQAQTKANAALEKLGENLEKGFKDFEISPRKPFISDEIINKTEEQGKKLQELLRRQRDTQDINEEKANAKKLETKEKQEVAAAERARKRQEDALRQTLRDIEELERRISQNSFTVLSVDESQLLASKDKIKKAIEDIDAEARRRNLSVALDVAADPAKIKQIKDEIDKLGVKDGKLTIKAETTKPEPVPILVKLQGGPTFFKELIQSAIVEAKGERIPLVFTAVPG